MDDEMTKDLHRDAVCKLVKGDEWVVCGESVVAEYLAQDYRWDYQATAESRSISLALWRYWHDEQKKRADTAEAKLADLEQRLAALNLPVPEARES